MMMSCLGACSTIINGSDQTVEVTTTPAGASVLVDGELIADKTPCSVELRRDKEHTLEISKSGFKTYRVELKPGFEPTTLGNLLPVFLLGGGSAASSGSFNFFPVFLLFGGVVSGLSFVVDYATGAAYSLSPDPVAIMMEPGSGNLQWLPAPKASP